MEDRVLIAVPFPRKPAQLGWSPHPSSQAEGRQRAAASFSHQNSIVLKLFLLRISTSFYSNNVKFVGKQQWNVHNIKSFSVP